MSTKVELRRELSVLRVKVADLEERCQAREERIVELFERIAPFFPVMSEAAKRVLEDAIKDENNEQR